MTPDDCILSLVNVCKDYAGVPARVPVLHGVNLQIRRGQSIAVIGPSGCGKSTLLNIMGLLDTPTSGEVRFAAEEAGALSPATRARIRNSKIGFVFQWHLLLPQCTILENVLVPTLVSGCTPEHRERAEHLLQRVGLAGRLHHRPAQLSGGESQRAAVVRALINRPALLLADEPTGSLNEEAADQLADLLLELNADEHTALVVVTHARPIAERMGAICELHGGTLCPKYPCSQVP